MLKRLGFAVVFLLALSSCKTTKFYMPGEKKYVLSGIYSEYYNIGEEYLKLKNYSKAAEFYIKAASDKEIANAAYFKAGRCYALGKNWTKALGVYSEIYRYDKGNSSVKESLAYIYAMSGDYKNSEVLYRELLDANPDVPEILMNYAVVLLTMEKYDEARAQVAILKEKFPDQQKIKTLEDKINDAADPSKDESKGQIPKELEQPEVAPPDDKKSSAPEKTDNKSKK